ncbi:aminotransferase class I/II-fold pyridoxal phosphate-dependent enzyme [Paroceanicella profunda]|uniref:Aminotransferase n=1 Tax=Paroceanicella profunda TaxID=2579971 RepID=A0A5B8FTC8_9RHOB|nr:aminotransferase class I/II-fold pyridoxal phosphate-dependent enzyme [Paroceanicella profunda]QDL92016.1 aminotransferase class I/II-fold pyridoxal phosphate-dependent enzyme [Paroceanicella profunda]
MTGHPSSSPERDHGGGRDAAAALWGGRPEEWLDLSTGINPRPFPLPPLPDTAWTRLPDRGAFAALEAAARAFWAVPDSHAVLPAAGASALIAALPRLRAPGRAHVPGPTYNEHAAAFRAAGWQVEDGPLAARPGPGDTTVLVHPNNPDGRLWQASAAGPGPLIVDESFADAQAGCALPHGRQITLKSFGKFWGLAGLRLGFAIGPAAALAPLGAALGPWAVSGPALEIGTAALSDRAWAAATRQRLAQDAARLDTLLGSAGLRVTGGTPLFRLAACPDAAACVRALARARVLVRRFPWSDTLLRFGLPGTEAEWERLRAALAAR